MSTTDRDRQYWEKHARKYDASMRLLGRPMPRMLELTGASVMGAGRVLEVAAGTGIVTPVLARSAVEVISTDYAAAMVEVLEAKVRAEGLTNVRCEQADLYALRFDEHSFDTVVAANVLHLVPDLPKALAALCRVLKLRGRLIVPTFCHDETARSWMTSRLLALTGFPSHRRFTTRSLAESLRANGVQVERIEVLPGLIPIGYVDGIRIE